MHYDTFASLPNTCWSSCTTAPLVPTRPDLPEVLLPHRADEHAVVLLDEVIVHTRRAAVR